MVFEKHFAESLKRVIADFRFSSAKIAFDS